MKNISEMWNEFLSWVDGYTDGGSQDVIQYSREDMRYAYQSGYESFCHSIVKKVDPDNLPAGENLTCYSPDFKLMVTGRFDENGDFEEVDGTMHEHWFVTHYIEQKDLIKLFEAK